MHEEKSIKQLISSADVAETYEEGIYFLLFTLVRLKQRELELEHGDVDYE